MRGQSPPAVGLVLPSMGAGASPEAIEAALQAARRAGWRGVWVPDHLVIDTAGAAQYGHVLDPIVTLAHVAARDPTVRLGTSVLVVPMRNAVVLAKELATLDVLSEGRLSVGVGAGWSEGEFRNVGASDRFARRGAYLAEAIRLWRHLWSGSQAPFEGEFHQLTDFVFAPLPPQRAALPIWVGGRSAHALRRAARLGDGYLASQTSPEELAERREVLERMAEAAGRQPPRIAARTVISPDEREAVRPAADRIRAFGEAGAKEVIVSFGTTDPEALGAAIDRLAAAL